MQSLFPTDPSEVTDEDLVELYAYPSESTWVRANFVSSVDGAAQGIRGRSGELSPSADQKLFALLRSLADVILVGGQTARVEGYQPVLPSEVDGALRARLGLTATPAIAVVSRAMDFDPGLLAGGAAPTLVMTTAVAAEQHADVLAGATVIDAGRPGDPVHVDAGRIIDELAARGYQRILCEGGPSLHYGLVVSGRLDELCLTINSQLAGGDPLRILTAGPYFEPPIRLELRHLLTEDGDLFCRYTTERHR
ncbi:MAG TPA: dihydrofolate reductase family protein [Nocardioidaceae bacterium]